MRQRLFLGLFLALFLIVMGCSQQPPTEPQIDQGSETQATITQLTGDRELFLFNRFPGTITAMSRNIYVGGDVDIVLGASDPTQIPVLVTRLFQQVQSTKFQERALALAHEIACTQPHVVGLQEVSLIRYQSPGDAVVGGTSPAVDTLYNYLGLLMRALRANGAHYKVAGVVQDTDVELPMIVSQNPLKFDDVRLTDFDVILVRHDVRVSDVVAQNYLARLTVPGVDVLRGFVAVTARVGRQSYRVVNTHLEVASNPALLPLQKAQARELLGFLANETLPIILTGDFNSEAPTGETYKLVLSEGFTDIWTENSLKHNPDGFTFGHAADLRNPTANFTERIDYIFVRNNSRLFPKSVIGPVFAIVVGDEESNKTASGLWPSDHGGVVARFRLASAGRLANAIE